ncbi:hypothetical protein BDR07DRAFT_852877 [Suillus spraguei]|nr:hypothetical protein BDR07DRAFT_852877 [Suillus spraguei]
MRKGKSSTQPPHTTSEATAPGGSHRPRSRVGRFLQKVREGAKKLKISRSKDSLNPSPVLLDERASSTPNLETTPSAVRVEADTQSALQDTQGAASHIHSLSEPAITVVSDLQGAQEDLDAADSFQDTYLEPLRIFDTVIGTLADVWTLFSIRPELILFTGPSIRKDGTGRVILCS